MNRPPPDNPAQQSGSQADVITHHGVYQLSNSNHHFYEQPQPAIMAQPMYFPGTVNYIQPNAMYQNDSYNQVDPYAQYHSGNQYFQSYSNAQDHGYMPGVPIQPSEVNPEFFQSVPPPLMSQRQSQFDESQSRRGYPKRGRGREGRGRQGGHGQWDNADRYVQSQEFYSAQRDRPQSNSRGRGRGQYMQPSFHQRDLRYGNGDGRHLNERSKKQYNNRNGFDSEGSRSRQQAAGQAEAGAESQGPNRKTVSEKNPEQNESKASQSPGTKGKELKGSTASSCQPANFRQGQGQVYDKRKFIGRGFSREYDSVSAVERDESQRGTLTEQLSRNQYECMVCCDIIKVESSVWSCQNCHHVFHLHCVKKWAKSSLDQDSQTWRCPGCQNVSGEVPTKYRCYCGRRKDPPYIRGEIPHSCGESCKKKRKGSCKHPCTLLCHPGPCPPCSSTVNQTCDCGRVRKNVRCAMATPFKCDQVCGKQLACDEHTCQEICHSGTCGLCTVSKSQECYCGKKKRDVFCGTAEYKRVSFSCEKSCGKLLSCGNHLCEVLCHPGECSVCVREPGVLSKCSCGKVALKDLDSVPDRQSCLDPVPTCSQVCDKPLSCGSPENPHWCEAKCHDGDCGPCKKETLVRCECGAVEKEIACEVAVTFSVENPFKCQKRCGKKKTCGRHKCSDACCVKDIHICELVCSRKLACGLHKCEQLCHRGNCSRCMQTSFEELTCFCGGEILEPPVPCGTRVPECRRPCTRAHDCDHPVRHNCHSDDVCPPCTELTERMCMGGHVLRKNIPCHLTEVSCGMPCNKSLLCKMHRCQKSCHKPPCLEEGVVCTQPCTRPRKVCGHMCKAPCHTRECPDTACKTEITISCSCGNRTAKSMCGLGGDQLAELAQFQHLSVQSMAESGFQGVDMAQFSQSKKSTKRLECDVNCAMIERNKRMALALEIRNPDIGAKLGQPTFSDFLKEFAKEKKNQSLILNVEKTIGELVQTAKQSSQSNRSHAFPPMNRDQRRFAHELAEFYGCETKSYDYEPNKNVVVTAYGEKCWLPNITLSQHMFKDQLPKAPPPLTAMKRQGVNFTTLKKKEPASEPSQPAPLPSSYRAWENVSASAPAKKPPAVDYFDFTTN